MEMTLRELLLTSLQEFLFSGRGMVVMALALVAFIGMFISPRLRWWGMAAMIFATGLAAVPSSQWKSNLIAPLEVLRTSGRAISSGLMLLLLLPMLTEPRRTLLGVSRPMVAYFINVLLICFHEIVLGSDPQRGLVALLLYPILFAIFGLAIARTLDSVEAVNRWLAMFAMSSAITVGVTLVQTLIDADQIVNSKRMFGLTANPNMFASYLACGVPIICYLISRVGGSVWLRIFYSMLLGLIGVFVLWSGSRGGLLMSIVGIVILFRLRIGKFALTAIAGVSCYLIALIFFGAGVADIAVRMTSLEDTRSGVWRSMLSTFLQNPLFGAGITDEQVNGSENSLLLAAAKYGLVGLLPMLIFMVMLILQMVRLERLRPQLPPLEETLVRVVNGTLAALLVWSMFDASLLSLWAPLFCAMLLALAIANAVEHRFGALAARGFEVIDEDQLYAQPSLR